MRSDRAHVLILAVLASGSIGFLIGRRRQRLDRSVQASADSLGQIKVEADARRDQIVRSQRAGLVGGQDHSRENDVEQAADVGEPEGVVDDVGLCDPLALNKAWRRVDGFAGLGVVTHYSVPDQAKAAASANLAGTACGLRPDGSSNCAEYDAQGRVIRRFTMPPREVA